MLRMLGTLLDRVTAVAGAFLFSQLPLYMNAYTQQLSGHVAELNLQIEAMRQVSLQTGKTLEQFVVKFMNSSEPDFVLQGQLMQLMLQRWQNLSDGLNALQNASLWEKPFVFVRYLNWDIAKATMASFEPGIPATVEGAAYAFAGLLAGFGLFWLLRKIVMLPFQKVGTLFRAKGQRDNRDTRDPIKGH